MNSRDSGVKPGGRRGGGRLVTLAGRFSSGCWLRYSPNAALTIRKLNSQVRRS